MLFALIDCNNFFVSCERVFNPKLNNKAVIVLSNNDGCIVARSNEAKALGIPMGAPVFMCRAIIETNHVIVRSSNYRLYADMSHRVLQTLETFGFREEVYSIDEAFLHMECADPVAMARIIRHTVLQWTAIPISVGIAATKTLAKAAGKIAKKHPEGIFALFPDKPHDRELGKMEAGEVWGIGSRTADQLKAHGIFTAKQLRDTDDRWIRSQFSITVQRVVWELCGTSCIPLEEAPAAKQSITSSQTFSRPIEKLAELEQAVASFAAKAAERLRAQSSMASYLSIHAALAPYGEGTVHAKAVFVEPTDYTPRLIAYAKNTIATLFQEGKAYRKTGVILGGLTSKKSWQQDLYNKGAPSEKQKAAMAVVDKLNCKYGKHTLFLAAEGTQKSWKMKQESSSSGFTTSWDELLTIYI